MASGPSWPYEAEKQINHYASKAFHAEKQVRQLNERINELTAELAAERERTKPDNQPTADLSGLERLVHGLTVSVDVSTGDDDAFHRIFGEISGVQLDSDGRPMLLAEFVEDNQDTTPADSGADTSGGDRD